jgi:hypothetical protein
VLAADLGIGAQEHRIRQQDGLPQAVGYRAWRVKVLFDDGSDQVLRQLVTPKDPTAQLQQGKQPPFASTHCW